MTETSPPEPPSEPAPTPPARATDAPAASPVAPPVPPAPPPPPSSPLEDHTNVISLEEEMKSSYLDYAMSVIVSRALPDVRDGLKPVQRRILYAMKEGGYDWNRPYRKSARIVGDVMSKYHPHGDSAIYDSMARMAQDFSLRVPLVDGQGNFGSMDDDPPAAMRYTEARLARVASEGLLEDFDRDTVDFQPTYDESSTEPKVLPARFPNLLVNGAAGIAVGMATSIPPHNMGEVLNAARAYVENPNIDVAALTELVPGPDFPTGGLIMGRRQLAAAYAVGRGSVRARARVSQEPSRRGGGREALVITEVPPGVSKGRLLDRLAHAVRAQIVEGIADVRDESARGSVRVVIEIKRGVMAELVLNHLWKSTPLQTTVSLNLLAIDAGRPVVLTIRDAIESFVVFREEVVARRTAWFLAQSRARAHLLVGLMVSVSHIDEVVILIRAASSPTEARLALLERVWPVEEVRDALDLIADPAQLATEDGFYRLSEVQARGILEMRLQRLTGLERDKIVDELRGLKSEIEANLEILRSRTKILEIVDAELVDMQERFATPRRTELMEDDIEQLTEDLIPREDVVVTLTHGGYVKRAPVSTYREQRRGGRGRAAMATHEDDFVTTAFVVSSHAYLLFFSTRGVVYRLKAWQLPEGSPQSRGKAMVNLLPLAADEAISALLPMPTDESVWEETHVVFATDTGRVRRNRLTDFARIRSCGKIAMHLEAGVRLIGVALCKPEQDVLLATGGGRCIRFPVSEVRVFRSRSSMGVRGIRLRPDDSVIALAVLDHTEATSVERTAFLAEWRAHRRETEGEDATEDATDSEPLEANGAAETPDDDDDNEALEATEATETTAGSLAPERYTELAETHEMLLSVAANGLGRRSSAYEYRTTRRGGRGIRNGPSRDAARVMAVFPILAQDGIMLIMDSGRMIRTSVRDVRVVGRTSRGVRLLKIYKGKAEHLVSATRIVEIEGSATSDDDNTGGDTNGNTNVDTSAPNGVAPEAHATPEAPVPPAANGGEESGS